MLTLGPCRAGLAGSGGSSPSGSAPTQHSTTPSKSLGLGVKRLVSFLSPFHPQLWQGAVTRHASLTGGWRGMAGDSKEWTALTSCLERCSSSLRPAPAHPANTQPKAQSCGRPLPLSCPPPQSRPTPHVHSSCSARLHRPLYSAKCGLWADLSCVGRRGHAALALVAASAWATLSTIQ